MQKYSRDDVLSTLDEYHATVMSTNWADYLILVYSVPFWEAELEKLTSVVQPYLHEPDVGKKFKAGTGQTTFEVNINRVRHACKAGRVLWRRV